jgi:hypothetical protein
MLKLGDQMKTAGCEKNTACTIQILCYLYRVARERPAAVYHQKNTQIN